MKRDLTIEDLGRGLHAVDVTVEFDCHPYEPATHEYPGCAAGIEFCGVSVSCYLLDDQKITRKDRPEWFHILDSIITAHVENNWEKKYEEEINSILYAEEDNC